MKSILITISCLLFLLARVFSEDVKIIDRNGNTSQPLIKCWLLKEYKCELGKTYMLVVPKDFSQNLSLHINDDKGDLVFMGSLEQKVSPGRTNDPNSQGTTFFIKLEYIKNSIVHMSGQINGKSKSYNLSLALPEQQAKPNKPRHATTSSRSVEMISRNYNPKPVSDFRRCY
jgi:hypothetical protein